MYTEIETEKKARAEFKGSFVSIAIRLCVEMLVNASVRVDV